MGTDGKVIDLASRLPNKEAVERERQLRESFFELAARVATNAQEGALLWSLFNRQPGQNIDVGSPVLKVLAAEALEEAARSLRQQVLEEETVSSQQ